MFCGLLNADLLLVPTYHMMDMNIISLVTISLLMVRAVFKLRDLHRGERRRVQKA